VSIIDAVHFRYFEEFEKIILQYPFGKVRNNEAFWAIRNTLTLGIKAAKNTIFIIY
jgi:hypothetical protein